jgi:peptidoglycan/LPS O-acetylase OafA/YrhL
MALVSGRLVELEASRGLAALTVFTGHFFANFLPELHAAANGTPFFAILNGPAAVILFFVLSGFVLTLRPIETQEFFSLLGPCLKRWPRLAGTVAVSSLGYILAAVTGAFPNPDHVLSRLPRQFPPIVFWGHGRHAELVHDVLWEAVVGTFLNGTAQHNDVLWTMRWELLGSFLAFALAALVLLPLRSSVRVALFVTVAVGATAFSPYLACFAVGVAGALFHKNYRNDVRLPALPAIVMLSCAVMLFSWDLRAPVGIWAWAVLMDPETGLRIWVLAQTTAAGLTIGIALYCRPARRMLQCRAAAFAGRMSFAVYLVHLLLICSFSSWTYLLLAPTGLSLLFGIALFGITATLVILIAYPLMRFDEWWVGVLGKAGRLVSSAWPRRGPFSAALPR